MHLTLAPEERLRAAPVRDSAGGVSAPLRRAADRLPHHRGAAGAAPGTVPVHVARGGYAARQLRRALAEYHAQSEPA